MNDTKTQETTLLPEPMIYAEPIAICFTYEDYVNAADHDARYVEAVQSEDGYWKIERQSHQLGRTDLRMRYDYGQEMHYADTEEEAWRGVYNHYNQTGFTGGDDSNFYTLSELDEFIQECKDEENEKGAAYMTYLKDELVKAIAEKESAK